MEVGHLMEKNHSSHGTARKALVELLNLPSIKFRGDDDKRRAPAFALAQRFIETYGPLRNVSDRLFAEAELFEYANRFRQIWTNAERREFRGAESALNEIFQSSDPFQKQRSGFTVVMQNFQIV